MNRKEWRDIYTQTIVAPSYIPQLQRLSMQRRDKLNMPFKVFNRCVMAMYGYQPKIYNLRTRPVTEMGVCSQVPVLPVSPIFIDACSWCSEEPGTTLFKGRKYCRECYLDALGRQARAQIRKEQNLRLKIVLMTGIFFQ